MGVVWDGMGGRAIAIDTYMENNLYSHPLAWAGRAGMGCALKEPSLLFSYQAERFYSFGLCLRIRFRSGSWEPTCSATSHCSSPFLSFPSSLYMASHTRAGERVGEGGGGRGGGEGGGGGKREEKMGVEVERQKTRGGHGGEGGDYFSGCGK